MSGWSGGIAQWWGNDWSYLSVAFTWKLDEAYQRAAFERARGLNVAVGGPALFLRPMRERFEDLGCAVGGEYPEAVTKHNPEATFASRGCPVNCSFCIVPAMEGRKFTLIDGFTPRPILCDNNLSGLPADYQDFIIRRYRESGTALRDANSGFEPATFTPDVYARWRSLVNEGRGPWRFAYDESSERREAIAAMRMLADEPSKRKRVYVLIGNEPFSECLARIGETIAEGCEPHVQPLMKLNALRKRAWVRFDWTEQRLRDVARWANGFVWKRADFKDYERGRKTRVPTHGQGSFEGMGTTGEGPR